ncbi:MAG: hypothetical protein R8K22_05080 [Mariprofundaceae bacterium]
MNNKTHLLRPEFTKALAKQLRQGTSINLISPHGQGRRRTLKDLRCCLIDSLLLLQVDMRDYQDDFEGMLNTLATQAAVNDQGKLDALISQLAQKKSTTLIIIHNFDLWHKSDAIKDLNLIKNHANISLLCVSEEVSNRSSLDAQDALLPAVTKEQLVAELEHRGLPSQLADKLLQQDAPYSFLDQPDFPLLLSN